MLKKSRKVKSRKVKSRKVKSRKVKSRKVKSRKVKSRKVKSRKVNFNMSPSIQEVDESVILHSGVYHGRRQKQEQLEKEQLEKEQSKDNFIFDFDNFCRNIGLIDDLALYDEIKFFVDTNQLRPKAMNNTIFGSNGIFKDNSLIPSLVEDLKLSTKTKKVYDYGSHKITIYPNRIIGEGSFGKTLGASFDNQKIVVKTLHSKGSKLLTNIVRETVIQSHLSCSYSRYLLQNDMALIPSVKLIGKTTDVTEPEYYIGMDKLTMSLNQYLPMNRDNSKNILKAINSVWKLIGYLQEKERFVHRDLHTGNIMYNASNDRFYIIDFGMSCLLNKNVINNDTLYDPIPLDGTTPWRYFNRDHDLRFFLGSVLDIMGYSLPKDIGKMIAKRFAYFAFTKYMDSDSSDTDSDSSNSKSGSNETIFSNLYQSYDVNDFRFSPRFNDDFMRDFVEQEKDITPEKIAGYKARNKLQRLVKYYYSKK
jgi:hypothetical protein